MTQKLEFVEEYKGSIKKRQALDDGGGGGGGISWGDAPFLPHSHGVGGMSAPAYELALGPSNRLASLPVCPAPIGAPLPLHTEL